MKKRVCLSCLMMAVSTVSMQARATLLIWDSDGTATPAVVDGSGNWDTINPNFYDGANNVAWTNTGNDARFGNLSSGFVGTVTQNNIDLASPIVVNNLTAATATNGAGYSFSDFGGGSLTINGDVQKASGGGVVNFLLVTSSLTLGNGLHNFAIRDTPGDAAEITMNAAVTGNGGVTLDNQVFESWGTLALNFTNNYTGATNVNKGRLVITDSGSLGTTAAGTTIGDDGTLAFGGAGLQPTGPLTIAEPITVTRSDYSSDADHQHYATAIQNNAVSTTITAPITISTTDFRITTNANGNAGVGADAKLTIPTNLVTSGMISEAGGGNGVLELTGDNTGVAAGFQIRNGEISVANQNAIGGPSSTITFGDGAAGTAAAGGGYLRVVGDFMTDFGTHNVNYGNFSGGLDIPNAADHFDITQSLTGGQIVKRGAGTLNLSGTNSLSRENFIDLGTENIVAGTTTSTGALRVRNGSLVVNDAATYATTVSFTSIGVDPGENATVTILGSGILNARDSDFNVSDNGSATAAGGSKGTLNITGATAQLNVGGNMFVSKNNNTKATVTQSGANSVVNVGTAAVRRNLIVGSSGSATVAQVEDGTYNMNGGTLHVTGETQIGNQLGGTGKFIQTAGAVTTDGWTSVGRFGGLGLLDISGGTFTNTSAGGGNAMYVGESTGDAHGPAVALFHGNAVVEVLAHEFWIGQGRTAGLLAAAPAVGTVTVTDTAQLKVDNNWIAVGRGGGTGTLIISGTGSVTKAGGGNLTIGSGGLSVGTVTQTGGTLTSNSTYVCEGGTSGLLDLQGGTASLGALIVGRNGNGGILNISGTANVTAGAVVMGGNNAATDTTPGTINLSAGTFKATSIGHGIGTGTATVAFTGGALTVNSYTLATPLANSGTGSLLPGGVGAIGATAVTGGYTQAATASTTIELASASSFDTVTSPAALALDGTLNLSLTGGYVPADYVAHVIMTGVGDTGHFAAVTGVHPAGLAATRGLAVTYSATNVTVTAAVVGDTNVDGKVNFADLLSLAQKYGNNAGMTWADGDFSGEGNVNFNDLLGLAQNYGFGGSGTITGSFSGDWALAQSLAPEPTALTLFGLAGLTMTRRRRSAGR